METGQKELTLLPSHNILKNFYGRWNTRMMGYSKSDPKHNHGSVTHTSCDRNHAHQCLDITGPAVMTADGGHVHHSESWVMYEDGHTHYYKAVSGPSMPTPNGGYHVHNWDFYTTVEGGHRHRVTGPDMPAPGV
jgi:hypothetical protein